jgi:hypothetical protein
MRLTIHEIMLIVVICSALVVGALVKRYRNVHSLVDPLPISSPER